MNILTGDIGGTKTLLRVDQIDGEQSSTHFERCYPSRNFTHFDDLLRRFIEEAASPPIDSACLAVAGPVVQSEDHEVAKVTNLPWEIDSVQIAASSEIRKVRIINDFQAVGFGVPLLKGEQLVSLQAGRPIENGLRVAIGAGTGFGTTIVSWCDGHRVHPTEAGHADFAPRDEDQLGLLNFLRQRHDRVTVEHLLSGPGLLRVHEYVLGLSRNQETPELTQARQQGDAAASISAFAERGVDPVARQSMDLFIRIYGGQAGDIALMTLPRGGLYIAGGIAPKIVGQMRDGGFMEAFLDKSPMAGLLVEIPVRVVMEPRVGLLGALYLARRA